MRTNRSPLAVTTVTRCTNWPMSPLWPPAFPCSAPPTVPGMPTRVSRPASPAATDCESRCEQRAPRRRTTGYSTATLGEAWSVSRMTPLTPSSRISTFDPPPRTRTGSSFRGSTSPPRPARRHSAARPGIGPVPPTFSQVYGASGSSRRVMSLKSASELMTDPINVSRSHQHDHVAGTGLSLQCCELVKRRQKRARVRCRRTASRHSREIAGAA